jgi:CubicO group peptidase (beta-lactamase class C family)
MKNTIQRSIPTLAVLSILLTASWGAYAVGVTGDLDLPRSTPEAEGVSSKRIQDFLAAFEGGPHEMHGLVIVRHGKVIAEGWWNPYRSELKHTLYSTSKSFTSTAIGFAVSEKRLTVDDKVISFFPEDLPDEVSDHLSALRIKDLLSMSVGMDPDPTGVIPGGDVDWARAFLATPIIHEPGTTFLYNSMGTHMLSAIVTKVTGETVLDYLTPRLFEPLGIRDLDWETDPAGNNTGGWGLRLRAGDMAKFGQLLLQKGVWKGRQIVPEAWIDEATTMKILQSPDVPKTGRVNNDWLQGYGYQFWRSRNNAYRADGAFGQYILVMPEQDAVIAITSETPDMQGILNHIWEKLLSAMEDEALPEDATALAALQNKLQNLAIAAPSKGIESPLEKTVSGKTYVFSSNEQNLKSIAFQFGEGQGEVVFTYEDATHAIPLGKDDWAHSETRRHGPYLVARAKNKLEGLPPFKTASACTWQDEHTLVLTLRYIESPHTETLSCVFDDEGITVDSRNSFSSTPPSPTLKGALEK